MKRSIFYIIIVVLLGANVALFLKKQPQEVSSVVKESEKYPLLARRIFAENYNDILINFTPVRKIIDDNFSQVETPHSVYFEYLPTGTTVREQAENQLVAASLVKLPLVMNLYHAAEIGKVDLDKKLQLTEDDLDPDYGDLYLKGAGYSLSLREAAKTALTKSDNTAARMINRTIDGLFQRSEEALYRLDIDYDLKGTEAIFNSRSYTSILTCLYFSCYLEPQSSQEILTYLSTSNFTERLTKDIPDTVTVAHKFGTYDELKTYSDCGIFYVPKRHYILCILMQGDETEINQIISETSKLIYEKVKVL